MVTPQGVSAWQAEPDLNNQCLALTEQENAALN